MLSLLRVWVQSLVGELRSHKPPVQPKRKTKKPQTKQNRGNVVTNSIKTFKMVHIKKKKKNLKKKSLSQALLLGDFSYVICLG